ncbi:MAG TPA: hypothetical protein VKG86_05630, partial [Terracidiphilus sp.]|nr:hypothetical protein [Terracidiphilus sp.]
RARLRRLLKNLTLQLILGGAGLLGLRQSRQKEWALAPEIPQRLKPLLKIGLIAALKRCATQNQFQERMIAIEVIPATSQVEPARVN